MKSLLALLLCLSTVAAHAQQCTQVVFPTQCYGGGCGGGGCFGGSCQPQYYSEPHPGRPSPDGVCTPPVSSPSTPNFQPCPPPAVTPTPPQKNQPDVDWAEWLKRQNEIAEQAKQRDEQSLIILNKISVAIEKNQGCKCEPIDLKPIEQKLDVILAAVEKNRPLPPPSPAPAASVEQHVVIVADHNAPYWQRIAEAIQNTKKTYAGVQDTTLPAFAIGIHPQAVVYRNNVPVRIVKGQFEVEALLTRLARGEPI